MCGGAGPEGQQWRQCVGSWKPACLLVREKAVLCCVVGGRGGGCAGGRRAWRGCKTQTTLEKCEGGGAGRAGKGSSFSKLQSHAHMLLLLPLLQAAEALEEEALAGLNRKILAQAVLSSSLALSLTPLLQAAEALEEEALAGRSAADRDDEIKPFIHRWGGVELVQGLSSTYTALGTTCTYVHIRRWVGPMGKQLQGCSRTPCEPGLPLSQLSPNSPGTNWFGSQPQERTHTH